MPVRRAVSNRSVPAYCVPIVWQEGGMNSVPALVCLAARHFSLSNQTVRLEGDPYSCLIPSPKLYHPEKRVSTPPRYTVTLHNRRVNGAGCLSFRPLLSLPLFLLLLFLCFQDQITGKTGVLRSALCFCMD